MFDKLSDMCSTMLLKTSWVEIKEEADKLLQRQLLSYLFFSRSAGTQLMKLSQEVQVFSTLFYISALLLNSAGTATRQPAGFLVRDSC